MVSRRQRILWVDDEIDLLRSHILYLEGKGYQVSPVSNGVDALNLIDKESFDVVLLDEMMPGMGGLEVLDEIQRRRVHLPVIMITKSEEENLMNEALGHRIHDYLIKPVNPSQIFLACKKLFETKTLVRGTAVRDYVREQGQTPTELEALHTWDDWVAFYRHHVRWDLELDRVEEDGLHESHRHRLAEANRLFGQFIEANYRDWLHNESPGRPTLSPDIVPRYVIPHLQRQQKVGLVVIDCLRLDEWEILEPLLSENVQIERDLYCSILPSATAYSRNAIFSGLYPDQIARRYPEFWSEAQSETESKNRFEREMLLLQLERHNISRESVQYKKVVGTTDADDLMRQIGSYATLDLVALVFTFVDTFTHSRSRNSIMQEFAQDFSALRAHLRTWFERSVVLEAMRAMERQGRVIVVTTDHGSIQVRRPSLVRADRSISSGVRFKYGKAPNCDPGKAWRIFDPAAFRLPAAGVLKNYLFAKEDYFFVYPTNRNEHQRKLRFSLQHGGISMEELICPLVTIYPG